MSLNNPEPSRDKMHLSEQNALSKCPHYALIFIDEHGVLHHRFSPSIAYVGSSILSDRVTEDFLKAVVRHLRLEINDSCEDLPLPKKRSNGRTAMSGVSRQMAHTMISVGNEDLRSFYEQAFEDFQQTNCRVLAKAYIKLIEPRKQVNHPYNGRVFAAGKTKQFDPEATKPPCWPSSVTHREPDHLLKPGM